MVFTNELEKNSNWLEDLMQMEYLTNLPKAPNQAVVSNGVVKETDEATNVHNPISLEDPSEVVLSTTTQRLEDLLTSSDEEDEKVSATNNPAIVMGENMMINDNIWKKRLQDKGCKRDKLPKKTYKRSSIMALGTKDDPIYYYDLTSIAIDMTEKMYVENNMGRGWSKIPKNKTNVKTKIVERLLAMRKLVDGKYTLDQTQVIGTFTNMWGSVRPAAILHHIIE